MSSSRPLIKNASFLSNQPLFLSLVWRVLSICTLVVIIPLGIYSVLLYRHLEDIHQLETFLALDLLTGENPQSHISIYENGVRISQETMANGEEPTLFLSNETIHKIAEHERAPSLPNHFRRIGTNVQVQGTPYTLAISAPLSTKRTDDRLWHLLSILFLLFLLVGGSGLFWLIYKMAQPLQQLAQAMHRVESGDFDSRYIPIRFGFEVNRLGYFLNSMLDMLEENFVEREKQTIEKKALAQELEIGHTIQKNLFPKQVPNLSSIEIASAFHAADRVAGDFYDLYMLNDKLFIVMADAAGKGISACLFSVSLRGMLRSALQCGAPLARIVQTAHQLLSLDAQGSGMFITAWIGLLDLHSMELTYLSQGHYPALLKRGSDVIELDSQGSALGVETDHPMLPESRQLERDDLLFLYTDGLIEALHSKRREIAAKLAAIPTPSSAAYVVEAFTTPPPYPDDLTLLSLRINIK
jgi:hypothetical protein